MRRPAVAVVAVAALVGLAGPAQARVPPERTATAADAPRTASARVRAPAWAQRAVRLRGYTPDRGAQWCTACRIKAVSGVATRAAGGHDQRVFFFVRNGYLGTDTREASISLRITRQVGDTVWVSYGIFRPSDRLCCASSRRTVRYRWTGRRLVPLDRIPPKATSTRPGR